MAVARMLLVPSFTELEWGVRPALEQWAEVASFDMPGVGKTPIPADLELDAAHPARILATWREAGAEHALQEIDARGWDRFIIVMDSHGAPTGVRIAKSRSEATAGLAIGHAALSHASEGERAPTRAGVWEAMAQLARQGSEPLVRYALAQMTRGGIGEEQARQMIARFPDPDLVGAMVEALMREPEPIGEDLADLSLPLLLAKHEGCLARTDEGFEDIVGAFPDARTAICQGTCTSSPTFAAAVRDFCERLD